MSPTHTSTFPPHPPTVLPFCSPTFSYLQEYFLNCADVSVVPANTAGNTQPPGPSSSSSSSSSTSTSSNKPLWDPAVALQSGLFGTPAAYKMFSAEPIPVPKSSKRVPVAATDGTVATAAVLKVKPAAAATAAAAAAGEVKRVAVAAAAAAKAKPAAKGKAPAESKQTHRPGGKAAPAKAAAQVKAAAMPQQRHGGKAVKAAHS